MKVTTGGINSIFGLKKLLLKSTWPPGAPSSPTVASCTGLVGMKPWESEKLGWKFWEKTTMVGP